MLYTQVQAAKLLNINISTLDDLVNRRLIPYSKFQTNDGIAFKFNPAVLEKWLKKPLADKRVDEQKYFERQKKRIQERYPEALKKLQEIDKHFREPRKPKGYNLVEVYNKKTGLVYYVRYIVDGKLVYSRWCTYTNDREAAARFAVENRERILAAYYERGKERKTYIDMYSTLKKYYAENSPYLKADYARGRTLGENTRITYYNNINNHFIPYLRKNRIKRFEEIDTPLLARYQDYLLTEIRTKDGVLKKEGISPQTANHYISHANTIFEHLLIRGYIKNNPFTSLTALKVRDEDIKARGCYDVTRLKGVVDQKWKKSFSRILNIIQLTSNIRNCEIERMQNKDFFQIKDIWFLSIPKEKSKNKKNRIVPIHDKTYHLIKAYARKEGRTEPEDYIFKLPGCKRLGSKRYKEAYLELGEKLGYTEEMLKEENITFYSDRHFWKTVMSKEKLGVEAEEFFMGHINSGFDKYFNFDKYFTEYKSSGNVKENYNHLDKHGSDNLIAKAKEVFAILERRIFA